MPRRSSTHRKSSAVPAPRRAPADNRRQPLLDAAAKLFSTKGYDGTSIRDITAEVGMLPGSMYYHFKSKEELVLAVHEAGVGHIQEAVNHALGRAPGDPWARLEAACAAHLEALLDGTDYAQVVVPQFARTLPSSLREEMIRQRDSYERLFRKLVNDLPLATDVNRKYLRLAIFGGLNWSLVWYRPGGDPPRVVAKRLLQMFRLQLEPRTR